MSIRMVCVLMMLILKNSLKLSFKFPGNLKNIDENFTGRKFLIYPDSGEVYLKI